MRKILIILLGVFLGLDIQAQSITPELFGFEKHNQQVGAFGNVNYRWIRSFAIISEFR